MESRSKPKPERGSEHYPSPERMQEIEEVFRKMGLETEEKRREILSQGFVNKPEHPPKKDWVTSLSDSSEPYTPQD